MVQLACKCVPQVVHMPLHIDFSIFILAKLLHRAHGGQGADNRTSSALRFSSFLGNYKSLDVS